MSQSVYSYQGHPLFWRKVPAGFIDHTGQQKMEYHMQYIAACVYTCRSMNKDGSTSQLADWQPLACCKFQQVCNIFWKLAQSCVNMSGATKNSILRPLRSWAIHLYNDKDTKKNIYQIYKLIFFVLLKIALLIQKLVLWLLTYIHSTEQSFKIKF